MTDAAPATINTSPPTLATGAKVVGSEFAPSITAGFIAGALAESYGLFVKHWGWWEIPESLFILLALLLFSYFRKDTSGHGRSMPETEPPKPPAPPPPDVDAFLARLDHVVRTSPAEDADSFMADARREFGAAANEPVSAKDHAS